MFQQVCQKKSRRKHEMQRCRKKETQSKLRGCSLPRLRRNPRDLRHLPRRRAEQRRHFWSAVETKKKRIEDRKKLSGKRGSIQITLVPAQTLTQDSWLWKCLKRTSCWWWWTLPNLEKLKKVAEKTMYSAHNWSHPKIWNKLTYFWLNFEIEETTMFQLFSNI